jgi:DNA-binding GntR family transcriptional regulator
MRKNVEPLIDVSNINEKIYNFLKNRIVNLTYPPGQKLNVRQLMEQLGVSQTPIKDALFRLAGEGLVDISSRRGSYVKEVNERDLAEIYDLRVIIETGAAEIIAAHITDEQLDELEQRYTETLQKNADSDYRVFIERAKEFHSAIIRFTDNNRLFDLYEQLNAHMQIVRFRFREREIERRPWTNQEHKRILKAFKERNPAKAKEAIRYHLETTKTALLRKTSQNTDDSISASTESQEILSSR